MWWIIILLGLLGIGLITVVVLVVKKKGNPACKPSCLNKKCGSDNGCGGSCACPPGYVCMPSGNCCLPECVGNCGDDGCGGSCGSCGKDAVCINGNCCSHKNNCKGKNCGDDGCGGSCGECKPGWECESGVCTCSKKCDGKQCGDDGCGGECPPGCTSPYVCNEAGQCICEQKCTGKQCGDDGCGGQCGVCQGGQECIDGNCKCICKGKCGPDSCGKDSCGTCESGSICVDGDCCPRQNNCKGKTCGDDGCGGQCGVCQEGQECIDGNCKCICKGKCGPDSCGKDSCGTCESGSVCVDGDCCPRQNNCKGKNCGDDGCGGQCGVCKPGWVCASGVCTCTPSCPKDGTCGMSDNCGNICGCPDGYACVDGKCTNNFIYGDVVFYSPEVTQVNVSSASECEAQAKKNNLRFWTYDSKAVTMPNKINNLNCYMFNTIPKCSTYSSNGISGDTQGKIFPSNLPSECAGSCTVEPVGGQYVPVPQYQPTCGTKTGAIDILSYALVDGIIPAITDSCRVGTPTNPCTSSSNISPYIFEVDAGKCDQIKSSSGSYYMCQPQNACAPTIPSESSGICISMAT